MSDSKQKVGRPELPAGQKRRLVAVRLHPVLISYVEKKSGSDDYESKTSVIEAALKTLMQLEP